MANNNTKFDLSAWMNTRTYAYYLDRLTNIGSSVFEWKNLPETVDPRFLEMTIFNQGMCLFFEDPALGFLALPCTIDGKLNVYNIPTKRRAYANSGYNAIRTEKDSVIIFHNYTHNVPIWDVEMFARRLSEMQRIMDVNIYAQKTPVVLKVPESLRLTYENVMLKYDGNIPLIIGEKNLNTDAISVFNTEAPFVADKINQLRMEVWNDAMTYFGVSNVNVTKRERLIQDEVMRNMGGTLASRNSPLDTRQEAAKQINAMFNLNIEVDYREDIMAYQTDILNDTITQQKEQINE